MLFCCADGWYGQSKEHAIEKSIDARDGTFQDWQCDGFKKLMPPTTTLFVKCGSVSASYNHAAEAILECASHEKPWMLNDAS